MLCVSFSLPSKIRFEHVITDIEAQRQPVSSRQAITGTEVDRKMIVTAKLGAARARQSDRGHP